MKLCECGCGKTTSIATKTWTKFGHVKGKPMRYLVGHYHKRRPLAERFWQKVDKKDGCWLWQAAQDPNGYGRIRVDGKTRLAHRIAYFLIVGEEPPHELLHECDTRACVRIGPGHVVVGSHKENMAGASERDRIAQGEQHGRAKLTEKSVRLIRADWEAGVSQAAISRAFSVSRVNINRIVHRYLWRHI